MKHLKNRKTLEYKGYKGSIDYSEEDKCYFGEVLGLKKAVIIYEGETIEELKKDFQDGVEDYIDFCKEHDMNPEI